MTTENFIVILVIDHIKKKNVMGLYDTAKAKAVASLTLPMKRIAQNAKNRMSSPKNYTPTPRQTKPRFSDVDVQLILTYLVVLGIF